MTDAGTRAVTTMMTVGLTSLALRALFAESFRRTPPADASGAVLLRYGVGMKAVGVVTGVLIPLALLGVALFAPPTQPGEMAPLLGLIAGFALLGVPIVVITFRGWARVSTDGIESHSPLGTRSRVSWSDVRTVEYSGLRGALVFRDGRGTVVPVSMMAVGLPALLGQMEDHLPRGMYEPAVKKGLQSLGRQTA
jgi:hypothetical protein